MDTHQHPSSELSDWFKHRNPHRPIIARATLPFDPSIVFLEEPAFVDPTRSFLSLYPPPRPFSLEYEDQGSRVLMWRTKKGNIAVKIRPHNQEVFNRASVLVKAMVQMFRGKEEEGVVGGSSKGDERARR